jgi:NAD(P)-dependent dehydrogenase (short-subunit alcohol dehydrogenase family)
MSRSTRVPVGVSATLASSTPTRTALSQFLLLDRVALVTGGHRGIGLEMALALAEAGATVYCLDLPSHPDRDWFKVQSYAAGMPSLEDAHGQGKGRLEYVQGDVTDQAGMWRIAEEIVEKEGRIDICIANAGIVQAIGCLEYSSEDLKKVCRSAIDRLHFVSDIYYRCN